MVAFRDINVQSSEYDVQYNDSWVQIAFPWRINKFLTFLSCISELFGVYTLSYYLGFTESRPRSETLTGFCGIATYVYKNGSLITDRWFLWKSKTRNRQSYNAIDFIWLKSSAPYAVVFMAFSIFRNRSAKLVAFISFVCVAVRPSHKRLNVNSFLYYKALVTTIHCCATAEYVNIVEICISYHHSILTTNSNKYTFSIRRSNFE